jgi:hypothetical protein
MQKILLKMTQAGPTEKFKQQREAHQPEDTENCLKRSVENRDPAGTRFVRTRNISRQVF